MNTNQEFRILTHRIIPCLDVRDGNVVKGVRFRNHRIVGSILELAARYQRDGADELVFYDITASPDGRSVDRQWVNDVARLLDIPFCVAGGIRTLADAEQLLNLGADKLSINSPALENPAFVDALVDHFGSQCVVIGIDSLFQNGSYQVHQFTGDPTRTQNSGLAMLDWAREVQSRGAGEIVLNCMNQDGVREGYDIDQLRYARHALNIPLIASGGAGSMADFREVFVEARTSGALAASVFHTGDIAIPDLKRYLAAQGLPVRI